MVLEVLLHLLLLENLEHLVVHLQKLLEDLWHLVLLVLLLL
jgi:hypothetical protein